MQVYTLRKQIHNSQHTVCDARKHTTGPGPHGLHCFTPETARHHRMTLVSTPAPPRSNHRLQSRPTTAWHHRMTLSAPVTAVHSASHATRLSDVV